MMAMVQGFEVRVRGLGFDLKVGFDPEVISEQMILPEQTGIKPV